MTASSRLESPDRQTHTLVSVTGLQMVGLTEPDPLAAQWLVRTFLALWHWPLKDPDAEDEMVRRFLGPPYAVYVATT